MQGFILLVALVLISSCSDNQQLPDTSRGIFETVSAPPLAVLAVEQQDEIGELTSVALDATNSRRDPVFTGFKFEIRQNQPNRKVLLAGPGQTTNNYVHVLLPAGTYDVTLTGMDSVGESASVTETITVEGSEPKDWKATQVEWSLDPFFQPGDETETYSRSNGPFSLALAYSLYEAPTLGSSSGCGGMLNNAGNGIGIVTGVIGIGVAIAAPELKVAEVGVKKTAGATASAVNAAGASTKIAGGNKSGACVQAQIDQINDQLHFQEEQILDLYSIIDRDEELFFKALIDEEKSINSIENLQFQDALAKFSDPLRPFMQAAALWESTAPWMVGGEVLELDLLKIAASDSEDPACTVGVVEAASCENVAIGEGPIDQINGQVPLFGTDDLATVAGLRSFDDCEYDCWQHVGPVAASEANALVDLYKDYAEQLYAEVILCTSPDTDVRKTCRGSENNVVPLFDQYNTAIAMQYLKAVNAVQKSHSIRQLINLYNYNRYVASECANNPDLTGELTATCLEIQQADSAVSIKQIGAGNSIPGTFYKHNGTICGRAGNYAQEPEQNREAFSCAQQQLGLFYAQILNVLYTHALNFTITDGPVGSQAYPATSVVFPPSLQGLDEFNAALQNFNLNLDGQNAEGGERPLGPRFDYEYEVGRSLPLLMDSARTPIDLLTRVAGVQTASNSAIWTADGAIYQAYHLSDAAACVQTLLDYNASGLPDAKLEDIYSNYGDCPSIFALHDGTSVANGFYDGITVQPYSFKVAPGGAEPCPGACNTCQSGFDINDPDSFDTWYPGGQGLFGIDSDTEQCRGFCSGSTPNDVPDNTCGDYDFADTGYTDCTQCSDSANVAVFALSAPMGGNVRQCHAGKVTDVTQGAVENETLSCNNSVYYGKRYFNSLSENGAVAPGDGTEATFKQIIHAGEYSLRPSPPAPDWSSPTGDNGSWSAASPGSYPFCEEPVFSGYAGNPDSPPTMEATCETYYRGTLSQYNKVSCASGRWGLDAETAQLFCEASSTETAFSSSDVTCSNTELGGDPSPGYYKQCFCPEGNQLGWLRPESTTDPAALAPGLTYLSCGNFAEFNPPRVAWEYEYSDGAQVDADDDAPPTYFEANRSTSTPTFEEDIGILGTTGTGVNYEVAFANVNTDCNALDNIQLDVVDTSNYFTCTSPKPYRDELTAATWIDPVTPDTYESRCLQFSESGARITNRANDTSVHYNMIITPKNRLGTGNGPGIPIDLVMQCSDDRDDGNDECDDQSMCMHMVSFKDPEVDTSAEKRAEAMAKRGYICKGITNQQANTRSNENQAVMSCELSDGRKMRLGLNGYVHPAEILDDRAKITISISD